MDKIDFKLDKITVFLFIIKYFLLITVLIVLVVQKMFHNSTLTFYLFFTGDIAPGYFNYRFYIYVITIPNICTYIMKFYFILEVLVLKL